MKSGIKKLSKFWKSFYKKVGKLSESTDENVFFLTFKEFEMDLLIVLEEGEELSSTDFLTSDDSLDKQQKFQLKGPCKILIEITQNCDTTFEKFLQLEKDILYLKHICVDPGVVYGIVITNQKYEEGLKKFDLALNGLLETKEDDIPEIENLRKSDHLFYLYKKCVNLVEKIAEQEKKIANLKLEQEGKIGYLKEEQEGKIANLKLEQEGKIDEEEGNIEDLKLEIDKLIEILKQFPTVVPCTFELFKNIIYFFLFVLPI